LSVRDAPRTAHAFWGALLAAAVPWLGLGGALPAAVVALAIAHWLRRRRRGLAGLAALEVVLMSAVVFVAFSARLYGGLTPYAARRASGPVTGIHDVGDALARLGRLGTIVADVVPWAPFSLLAAGSLWLLWCSRRTRVARIASERVDVEIVAAFLALACAAQVVAATFLAPALHGAWFDTRMLVPVAPLGAALAAWAARRWPRSAATLAVLTVAATAWLLGATLLGHATPAPPHGLGL
ncbi:MAG TPA: hypothetical protein VHB30_04265, partial [Solirubrobacteraceae bacterium]|nr:hypothetical protein [Solirubrobacteraceae bacterium]